MPNDKTGVINYVELTGTPLRQVRKNYTVVGCTADEFKGKVLFFRQKNRSKRVFVLGSMYFRYTGNVMPIEG